MPNCDSDLRRLPPDDEQFQHFPSGETRNRRGRCTATVTSGSPHQPPRMAAALLVAATLADSPNIDRDTVFRTIVERVALQGIQGDYLETGVHTGNSAVTVGAALKNHNLLTTKRMWLYDAWQGMPEVTAADGETAKAYVGTWGSRSQEAVANRLSAAGIDAAAIVWRKGWFNETFLLPKPASIAFLHIDSDWYNSVMTSLDAFYDLVAPGGVVLFDDFGFWEGTRRAFYDFCHKRQLYPLVERIGSTQLYFVNGKTHNRPGGRGRTSKHTKSKPGNEIHPACEWGEHLL